MLKHDQSRFRIPNAFAFLNWSATDFFLCQIRGVPETAAIGGRSQASSLLGLRRNHT